VIWNWLLSHLACGLAAAIFACVCVDFYRPRIDAVLGSKLTYENGVSGGSK
jgi:hypothetical protein